MYSLHLIVCFSKTKFYCRCDHKIRRTSEVRYLKGQFWVFYMWLGCDNSHNKLDGRKFRSSCAYPAAADREEIVERQTGCSILDVQWWQRRGLWNWPETIISFGNVFIVVTVIIHESDHDFFSKMKLLLEIKVQVVQCQVMFQRIWKQHLYSSCQCCFLQVPVTSEEILFKWKWASKAKGTASGFLAPLLTL